MYSLFYISILVVNLNNPDNIWIIHELRSLHRQFLRIIQIQDRLFADQGCSSGEEVAHEVVVNYHE